MRREANFGNVITKILRKSKREERGMMWQKEKKFNCSNTIAEIRREKKFAFVTIQLPKYERNNKNGNLEFRQPCCQNLEKFGAHKKRELVEGGEKIW